MSGYTFWNPEQELDKSCWDLAAEGTGDGPGMSGPGAGHVR
jgi:hypothetical protein